ncbi:MAG: glycosyltransferase [Deltaproteobacteria bacterium]|jgi:dolichol-phosphate mannosyltransferase|nr:glycosyltransferase [Deltaproteobacteria bacterium]
MDISVILPVINERENLEVLIPRLKALLKNARLDGEIVVVDGGSSDGTRESAAAHGVRVVSERGKGYGAAIQTGFEEARGDWVLTLDADLSHDPDFVAKMWRARDRADIVIASRYTRGGVAYTDLFRKSLSRLLNAFLRRFWSLPVRDVSSGYRLYRRAALEGLEFTSTNFEVLGEILVRLYARGYRVVEVPFTYFPRGAGRSHIHLLRFGMAQLRSALRMWKLRNSLESADYDERAYYSIIPFQRYWQRRRHSITVSWARGAGRILDAGCGSSLIVQSLNNAVGMEFNFGKLRFLRHQGIPLARGSAFALPFKDASFDCVISSQVIEHLTYDEILFSEMRRVLRPGGMLILGTPDYATIGWRVIEPTYRVLLPGGYADEHITHYTREKLTEIIARHGFAVEEAAYIVRSELIMRCRKCDLPIPAQQRTPSPESSAA